MKAKKGWAIHCHHNILIEFCYDYAERKEAIKDKPVNEVKTRLKLFKILPTEAEKDIPEAYQQAYKAWQQADKAWPQIKKDAFHKKWCGCKEWNGKEIVFTKFAGEPDNSSRKLVSNSLSFKGRFVCDVCKK